MKLAKRRVLTTQRARKRQYDFGGKFHPHLQRIGNTEELACGHRCIRKLFGLDSETCIRKLFPVDSETFPGGFGNFPVGFGNFPGCIRELVYSGNWDLVTKPLSSETFLGGFGKLYSETFPVGFGNLYSETFPGGFGNLYSETFPGGFGNFSGWIRKLARLDS